MQYGIAYRIQILNADKDADESLNNQLVTAMIYDRSLLIDDADTPLIQDLEGSGDPIHISSIDNDEDKFTGIKAIQATLQFLSTASNSLSTFVDAPIPAGGEDPGDPRWYVEVDVAGNIIFKGFLSLDDCSEDFMPNPNVVTLTANDGLGTLKDKPLLTSYDTNPRGYYRIGELLSLCLVQTGLSLNINAIFNIKEKTKPDSHYFDAIYLWAKTFEDEIGTCINCYDALLKVLGESAYLTQRGGEWWIVRVDELGDNNPLYVSTFDSNGTLTGSYTAALDKVIEKTDDIFFSQEQTSIAPKRPYKFAKELFSFNFPREIIDNIDFSRNDSEPFFTEEFTDTDDNNKIKVRKRYVIEDWQVGRYKASSEFSIMDTAITPYIERIFENDYEKERHAILPYSNSEQDPFTYLRSNPIPVSEKDKGGISVDFKFSNAAGIGDSFSPFAVILKGDDNRYYYAAGDPIGLWFDANSFNNSLFVSSHYAYTSDEEKTAYQTASLTFKEIPVNGHIYIFLVGAYNFGDGSGEVNVYYQNLQFTYTPYINGSYAKYTGLYHKAFRTTPYNATREKEVSISDSPKKLFKGALHVNSSYKSIVDATVNFSGDTMTIIGDLRSKFRIGLLMRITNATSNNKLEVRVKSISYATGITSVLCDTTFDTMTAPAHLHELVFSLTDDFYNGQSITTGTPADEFIHPYAHLQVFDVWNQYRNVTRYFQHTAQGLTSSEVDSQGVSNLPHLIHRYSLNDNTTHTTGRYFMLLHFDIDLRLCEWTGTLAEAYNSELGKEFFNGQNLEVKYTQ